jgi:hypothetical protein
LAFISEFNVQMLYLLGLKNAVANFLSCPPPPSPEQSRTITAMAAVYPVDFEAVATKQYRCAVTQRLLGNSSLKLALQQCFLEFFIPSSQQNFENTFFGICTQFRTLGGLPLSVLVSSRFVWRGLTNNIISWAKSCLHCQQSKIHRHTRLLPQPIPIPQRQFAHLHIDLVGPLQYCNGCYHILTIIDHTSMWMEAIPLS